MQKVIIFLAFSLALAFGQFNFPTTATQVYNNQGVSGAVAIQTYSTYYASPDLYYIYIPQSASSITVTIDTSFAPEIEQCYDDILAYYGNNGFACYNVFPFNSLDDSYPYCNYADDSLDAEYGADYDNVASETFYPYDDSADFVAGGYFYVSVSRESATDYNKACGYVLTINYTTCPNVSGPSFSANDINDDENTFCVTPVMISNVPNMTNPFTAAVSLSVAATAPIVYVLNLPQNVGNVEVTLNGNSEGIQLFATSYSNGNQDTSDGCSDYTTEQDDSTTYTAMLDCQGIAGAFYIYVAPADENTAFVGTITVSVYTCSGLTGARVGGPYCNSTVFDTTLLIATGKLSLAVPYNTDVYGFFDATSLFANSFVNFFISANNTDSDVTLSINRNGYPVDEDSGSTQNIDASYPGYATDNNIALSPLELFPIVANISTRYYLMVSGCNDENGCGVTISANATVFSAVTGGTLSTLSLSSTSGSGKPVATSGMAPMVMTSGKAPMVMTSGKAPVYATTNTRPATPTTHAAVVTGSAATTGSNVGAASSVLPSIFVVLVAIIALMF